MSERAREQPWQLFDELDAEAFAALKADIRERGVLVPVDVDEHGTILDGHHRVRAWEELRAEGVSIPDYPTMVRVGLDDAAKWQHVIALNLCRRHLSGEQRARYFGELRAAGMTLQEIARVAGVAVSTVHADLKASEIQNRNSEPASIVNARGQQRPAAYRPRAKPTPSIFATTRRQRQAVLDAAAAGVLVDLPASIVPADHKIIRDGAKATRRAALDAELALLPPTILTRPDVRLEVADALHMPLADSIVDLTVVSPVYGVGIEYDLGDIDPSLWLPFMHGLAREILRVTKPGGRFALNVPVSTAKGGRRPVSEQALTATLDAAIGLDGEQVRWEYQFTIDWHEGNTTKGGIPLGSQRSSDRPYHVCQTEVVHVFSRGTWAPSSDRTDDISEEEWLELSYSPWTFSGESRAWEGFPAAFPLELPLRLIRYLSPVGATVLDPCVGSGTTVLAALQLGRQAIGFDLSARSIESSKRRIAKWLEGHAP